MKNDIFERIKEEITIEDIFNYYGIEINRNRKALCCWHDDNSPSMSVNLVAGLWYCHVCCEGGDIFSFVALKESCTPYQAAQILDERHGLDLIATTTRPTRKQVSDHQAKKEALARFKEDLRSVENKLSDYFLLFHRATIDPPDNFDEMPPLYEIALKERSYTEYLLDFLAFGNFEDRAHGYKMAKQYLQRLEAAI
ncbi:MAG: CHC2 zinc finger domain-containing protein [Oscillospiraceae bacterium]|nr:CHC2 zinc finger domain-containing protein [Oscillospiraceae bacterium]